MNIGSFAPNQRPGIAALLQSNAEPVVEHAGSGLFLPESKAKLIDTIAKELPKDFTYRRLSAKPSEFELPEGERTDVSMITTDAKDRDGEVVLPQGGDWKNYNGVVPFGHDYKSLPVGVSWWIRPAMKGNLSGLRAKTHYPTKPADWGDGSPWLPSAVMHLMQQPIPVCTGKSIGFIPLNMRSATAEEKAKRPDWKDAPIIDRWVGIEYSVVPVPANDTSEMEAVSKAFASGAVPKEFADILRKMLKDMDDGDMTLAMPACPKCMSNENVKDDEGGMYVCSACGTSFSPANDAKAAEEAARREAALQAALTAPFYTEDAYRQVKAAQQEELAQWAQREAVNRIHLAIAAAAGKV